MIVRRALFALAFLFLPTLAGSYGANAQGCPSGIYPAGFVCGNATGAPAFPKATASSSFGGSASLSINNTAIVGGTANGLLYDNAATVGNLATGNNGVLITSGAGVPSISSTLPSAVQLGITGLGVITTGVWNGSTVGVGFGGTNCSTASGTCLDNITAFSSTGMLIRTGAGTYAFDTLTAGTGITVTNGSGVAGNPTVALTTIAADNILGNPTGGTAAPIAMPLLSCAGAGQALTYNTSSHAIGCSTLSGSGTVNNGTTGQLAWYPASTNVVGGNANASISNGTLTLGTASTTLGSLILQGSTSGAATLTPQATAGTPTLTIGTATGTIAAAATSPLAISATTGTVSITGVAGQVLGGSGPAFTATPTLGAAGVATGKVNLAGTTSGTVGFSVADVAGTWTMKLPTSAGSAGQFMSTDGSGNTTWANAAGGGTVNSGTAGQLAYYASSTAAVSGNTNANVSAGALTLGQANTTLGTLTLEGNTSGAVLLAPQAAAGTPTVTFGTSSGTPAVTASSPLAITAATGNITCATCATTTSGGALTATAPVTISSGGLIALTRTAVTVQTFLSGSGTYTTPTSPAPTWIEVKLVGGGAGGGAGGASAGSGVNGVATTFGTSLLSAGGGTQGVNGGAGGAGGTSSLGSGPTGIALSGGYGAPSNFTGTAVYNAGGSGGNSCFGGGGSGGYANTAGSAGVTNTGGGGGGGSTDTAVTNAPAGSGGGSGGCVDAIIVAPSATYSYVVGGGGAGGTGGTHGSVGASGGSGGIWVFEHYF